MQTLRYTESLRIGIRSIRAHKLRSFLTMLGMIFGVGAVTSMLSIAEGARREAVEQIRKLGTNTIRVHHRELDGPSREAAERRGSKGLALADAALVDESVASVRRVAPIRFVDASVIRGGRDTSARVVATSEQYARVTGFVARHGRFLVPLDVKTGKRVAVIGSEVRNGLFGASNAVGRRIRIGEQWFTVVGVMDTQTIDDGRASAIEMRNVNQDVYVPISTARLRLPPVNDFGGLHELAVQVKNDRQVPHTAQIVQRLLARAHQGIVDFDIVVPSELLAQAQRTQRVFNIVMGSIAAISLLVGGIGIMNVMLTTVTERTREIGIRRAVGATRRTILAQFLIETVLISTSGGCLGIALGAVMAKSIHLFAGWETIVSPSSTVLAFMVSALVGVIFGLVPAQRAARMAPVHALRFE
ncbi:MAG: ABC transporter permease [Myxococcota bacterium]